MAEYIERETVYNTLKAKYCDECTFADKECYRCAYADVMYNIDIMPAADVQPVNRWTSVDEALPQDCTEVLIYDKECGIIMGWYNEKDKVWSADFVCELETVTHWQPLPEPPETTKG